MSPLFTVFTPTYNRARTLERTCESLCRQTLRDFEWLVIDDGSTDKTCSLIECWQQQVDFPIRYFYQVNSSKAAAWNQALRHARGKFFVCLDSDDECVPEALESFRDHWESIPAEKRNGFSGVTALAFDQSGALHGPDLPRSPMDCNPLAVTLRLGRAYDDWQCYLTEVIRDYPFDLILGYRNYLPESVLINRLAVFYLQRHVNDRLLIIHTDNAGIDHGHQSCQVSRRAGLKHSPGIRAAHLSLLQNWGNWFLSSPAHFYKATANYIRFSWMQGISIRTQFEELASPSARILWLAAIPAAIALRIKDRYRGLQG